MSAGVRILDFIFYPLEIGLNAISLASLLVLLFLCNRVREFHTNLRFLLTLGMLELIVMDLTRLVLVPPKMMAVNDDAWYVMTEMFDVLYSVNDLTYVALNITVLFISIERLAATVLVKEYEYKYRSRVIRIVIVVTMASILACKQLFIGGKFSDDSYIFVAGCAIMSAIAFLLIAVCIRMNRRQRDDVTRPLSSKYQTDENIRALAVLQPVACLLMVTQLAQNICLAFIFGLNPVEENVFVLRMFTHSFNITSALFSCFSPWVLIYRHPRYLGRLRALLRPNSIHGYAGNGSSWKSRSLPPQSEKDAYFSALAASWADQSPMVMRK